MWTMIRVLMLGGVLAAWGCELPAETGSEQPVDSGAS